MKHYALGMDEFTNIKVDHTHPRMQAGTCTHTQTIRHSFDTENIKSHAFRFLTNHTSLLSKYVFSASVVKNKNHPEKPVTGKLISSDLSDSCHSFNN